MSKNILICLDKKKNTGILFSFTTLIVKYQRQISFVMDTSAPDRCRRVSEKCLIYFHSVLK